jgi:hypothetical protein
MTSCTHAVQGCLLSAAFFVNVLLQKERQLKIRLQVNHCTRKVNRYEEPSTVCVCAMFSNCRVCACAQKCI